MGATRSYKLVADVVVVLFFMQLAVKETQLMMFESGGGCW